VIVDVGLSAALCRDRSIGSQIADPSPRPDNLLTGITLEFSLPYLQSMVRIFTNTLSTVLDPKRTHRRGAIKCRADHGTLSLVGQRL
jgi:hypothetical protein